MEKTETLAQILVASIELEMHKRELERLQAAIKAERKAIRTLLKKHGR